MDSNVARRCALLLNRYRNLASKQIDVSERAMIDSVASIVASVELRMWLTERAISSVARPVWFARFFTSLATTASLACLARPRRLVVALRARRFVWPGTSSR